VEKTAEGLQAIRWFKEGRLAEIAEYCCYDVENHKSVSTNTASNAAGALSQIASGKR